MTATKKNGRATSRPLPPSLAPDDAYSTGLASLKEKTSMSANIGNDKVTKNKRGVTKKKKSKVVDGDETEPDSDVESSDLANAGGKSMKHYTGDSRAHTGGKSYTGGKTYTGGKRPLTDGDASDDEASNMEYKQEDSDGDFEVEGQTSVRQPLVFGRRKKQKCEVKDKTPNPNGRVVGRKLVMWHRPRMVEKLMLHLQYECHRADVKLPWDKIVERLSTGSSGASALQHLNKLRDILITEGHMVPPLLGKKSVLQDATIRGFIRDLDADKPTDTKVVRWGENVEDRKENLEIDGVVRGSGNYRRGTYKAIEKTQQASGERRNRVPVELRETGSDEAADAKPKTTNKKRSTRTVSSRFPSADPAELASDEDYDPTVTKKGNFARNPRKVSKAVVNYKVESSDDESEDDIKDEQEDTLRDVVAAETPRNKRLMGHEQGEEGLMTPPDTKTKILKLKVGRDALLRLGKESFAQNQAHDEEAGLDHELEQYGDDMEDGFDGYGAEDNKDAEAFGEYGTPTRQLRHSVLGGLAQEILQERGYGRHNIKAPKNKVPVPTPRPYTTHINRHGLHTVNAFADSSTGGVACNHTGHNSTTSMVLNNHDFGSMFNGAGGGHNISDRFDQAGQRFVVDPFYDNNNQYVSATNSGMFQTGLAPYSASGLPAMSFEDNFSMSFENDGSFHGNNSFNTNGSSSFGSGMTTTGNSANRTPMISDADVNNDAVSVAMSSPGVYAHYLHDDGKTKQEEFNLF